MVALAWNRWLQPALRSGFATKVNRNAPRAILVEHSDELKACPHRIQIVTQCRHPNILSMFKFRNSTLCYLETTRYLDLAQRFGMTQDGIKSRLKRARAQLRSRLIELADGSVS